MVKVIVFIEKVHNRTNFS